MSDGDRGKRDTPLEQGIGVFLAILLSCAIVSVLAFSVGRDSERDSQRTAEYHDYAERRERVYCADFQGAGLAQCQIEQQQAARQAYNAERDLDAQRDMALWALAVFVIGAITAGLTLWALFYVRGTLMATRDALRDTGEATAEMRKANAISNRIAEAELRPYLFVDSLELVDVEKDDEEIVNEDGETTIQQGVLSGKIVIHFRNYGKVPARNINVFMRRYVASFWEGRFWGYRSSTINLWLCAPSHERRAFLGFMLGPQDRRGFDLGIIDMVVRLRYSFEDDKGAAFTEDAAFRLSGDDLKTFFLFTAPYRIKEARERRKQRELNLADHSKRRKKRGRRTRAKEPTIL